MRYAAVAAGLVTVVTLLSACGGDDSADGEAPDGSPTPFIAPEHISTEEALAELDEIIVLVREPEEDGGVGESELQRRAEDALDGTTVTPGLNEVRDLLVEEERILAREFLHNTLVETLAPPFGESDRSAISADDMRELDPLGIFAPQGEDFEVSEVYREAARRIIALWYLI